MCQGHEVVDRRAADRLLEVPQVALVEPLARDGDLDLEVAEHVDRTVLVLDVREVEEDEGVPLDAYGRLEPVEFDALRDSRSC